MTPTKNPRVSYGLAILEAAKRYDQIVVLTCDVMHSCQTLQFAETFPQRFINLGVAEQNMAGVAAGLATCGKIPFINTFSCFASMRCLEMLRTDIAYPCLNVKVVCVNAGLSLGPGGTTHHATEDLAILRSIANLTILVPADASETHRAVMACIDHPGPVYIRLGRADMETVYPSEVDFRIGRANKIRDGRDVMVSCYYYYQKVAGMDHSFKDVSFHDFLYGRVSPGGRDRWPNQEWTDDMFDDPVKYWADFNAGWMDILPVIRFEDVKARFPEWHMTGAHPRKGIIGDHANHFNDEDYDYFFSKAGHIMERFGYNKIA